MKSETRLVVVPSQLERNILMAHFEALGVASHTAVESNVRPGDVNLIVSQCGVGLTQSGIRTTNLLWQHRPSIVVLIGIAGTYDEQRAPVCSAIAFDQVSSFGLGVGQGDGFLPMESTSLKEHDTSPNYLPLMSIPAPTLSQRKSMLVSVTACSARPQDVQSVRNVFPEAVAEDMEGYAVALACNEFSIPCQIIRGISNRAGDRNPLHWSIPAALESAAQLFAQTLAGRNVIWTSTT